jgi:hypothetical protein
VEVNLNQITAVVPDCPYFERGVRLILLVVFLRRCSNTKDKEEEEADQQLWVPLDLGVLAVGPLSTPLEVKLSQVMAFNFEWVRERVHRKIPPPKQLHARVKAVINLFKNKLDRET